MHSTVADTLMEPSTVFCVAVGLLIFIGLATKPKNLRGWLLPRIRWDTVERIQHTLRSKPADLWFSSFPFLGNEIQYVLMLPFMAWFFPDGGITLRRFTLGAFLACYLSNAVKTKTCLPRPPLRLHVGTSEHVGGAARDEHKRIAQQFGFPSTHSAHAVLLSTIFAHATIQLWAGRIAFVVCHTAHVILSRLYMGVHSLADVLGGLAVGTLLVGGGFAPCQALSDTLADEGGARAIAITAALLIGLLIAFPDKRGSTYEETVSFAGVYFGVFCGCRRDAWGLRAVVDDGVVSMPILASHYVAGLLALGLVRTAVSKAAKLAVKLVVPAGRAADFIGFVRVLLVNAFAGWYVMAIHPSNLVAAFR